MNRFQGKVVVITGASSGIGEALAEEFALMGSHVVLGARNTEGLEEVVKRITAKGGSALAVTTDVTSEKDCKELIDRTAEAFGRLDILICNAGISMRALFAEAELSVLHRLMDVNFWGTVNCVKFALPHIERSKGSIVGISSVAGIHGLPGRTGYSASKYAMTGFMETIRIENLKKGVHVMIACPGFTATNVRYTALTKDGSPQGKTPREEGKMMTAKEVALRIMKGIKKRKRLLLMESMGRGTYFIKKISPRFVDWMFYKVMSKEPDAPFA